MIRSLAKIFLLLLFLVAGLVGPRTPDARAVENFTLYLNELPHRLIDGSGIQYDLFLKEILDQLPFGVSLRYGPLARSKTNFLGDPQSCLFPTNIRALNVGDRASELETSVQVDVVSLRLYTADSHPYEAQLDSFAPERVGYIRGSGAVYVLGADSGKFLAIDSEEQLIRMIQLGRLDAFLGHHPDTALALDQLGKPGLLHVSPLAFKNLRFAITFICHDNETGHRFLEVVNPRVLKMRLSGRLREILGPHAEFRLSEDPVEDEGPLVK
ncbi:hypothetical protein [Roseibium sp. M-1]